MSGLSMMFPKCCKIWTAISADVRQSVLCGYFTMILLASFPAGVTRRDIERKIG